MTLPKQVSIVEVSPRDGLQNEAVLVTLEQKLGLVRGLGNAGLEFIEAGSFVNPARVPQMAQSDALFEQLTDHDQRNYIALVPNLQGFERAVAAGAQTVAVFTAASETFCRKNINCSIQQSLERFEPIFQSARQLGIGVRGYVSCVAGCPYEGYVDPQRVTELARLLAGLGCYEVCLADTTGVGTAEQFSELVKQVRNHISVDRLAVHCHDTYGQALANIYAALTQGIRVIDSSIAGLGGCPFARGASGNVATEDLVYMLHGCNIKTGIDLNHLIECGNAICRVLGKPNQSRVSAAIGGRAD